MIDALKNLFSKLFPKKLATETTAQLPTPTVVTEEVAPTSGEYEITISYADEKNPPEPLFSEPYTEPASTLEAPVVEGLEQIDPVTLDTSVPAPVEEEPVVVEEVKPVRARNKGKFAPDNKFTDEYNEAWVGGKSPAKKNAKKKKKH